MGAARRRREAVAKAAHPLSPDTRAAIARVVQGRTLITRGPRGGIGGMCIFHAIIGRFVLRVMGVNADITAGSVFYRAGPDPGRDMFAFSGPFGGMFLANGTLCGHAWLETDDDLIDFSVGNWRRIADTDPADYRRRIEWTHPPPGFHWGPRTEFSLPVTTITPGRACYLGMADDLAAGTAALERAVHVHLTEPIVQMMIKQAEREALALRQALD
jgi:hypothetical protein